MSAEPQRTFQDVFKKTLKKMLTYWTQIGVAISISSAGLGLMSLYAYTFAIGRTDLFMASADAKSALAIWFVIVALFLAVYIFLLFSTTWLFGLTIAMFNKAKDQHKHIVLWLALPVLSGFLAFILSSLYLHKNFGTGLPTTLTLITILTTSWLTLTRQPLKIAIRENLENQITTGQHDKIIFISLLVLFLTTTVVAGVSPTLLISASYLTLNPDDNVNLVAIICLLTLSTTLLPAIIFYRSNGDIYKRTLYGALSTIILFCSFITVLPGAMGFIAYRAAGGLDVRQRGVERFTITGDIELQDINNSMWKARTVTQGKIEVLAFQLFSFGDVLLLCPSPLLKLEIHQMKQYTHYCIRTFNSRVTLKPKQPQLPNHLKTTKSEPRAIYSETV